MDSEARAILQSEKSRLSAIVAAFPKGNSHVSAFTDELDAVCSALDEHYRLTDENSENTKTVTVNAKELAELRVRANARPVRTSTAKPRSKRK